METRASLIVEALRLERMTVGWLFLESAVAIGAGVGAHSLTLLAFGADSVIELLSAGLLLWRLGLEWRAGEKFSEAIERATARTGAFLLLALALYVVASAAWGIWSRAGQDVSVPGLVIVALAIPIMAALAARKRRLADALGSAALRADAAESIACLYLSGVVLAGLLAQWALGAWWVDGVSALALVPFLLKEALEAWRGGGDD